MAKHSAEDRPDGIPADILVIENRGCPDGHFSHAAQSALKPLPTQLRRRLAHERMVATTASMPEVRRQ